MAAPEAKEVYCEILSKYSPMAFPSGNKTPIVFKIVPISSEANKAKAICPMASTKYNFQEGLILASAKTSLNLDSPSAIRSPPRNHSITAGQTSDLLLKPLP